MRILKILLKGLLLSLLVLAGLLGITVFTLGLLPATQDPVADPRTLGAGASSVADAWSGLQRNFPPMALTADTVASADAVELGRLLFFDPILSVNNDRSCASCHHPDLGFADGLSHPVGINGQTLPRHTPTLWNVGWAQPLFWDGRAATLEEQAGEPLLHPLEMGSNAEGLALKLRNIPEYVSRFETVFGAGAGNALSFEHILQALAAFERTLISTDSAYDRFAAGDFNALSESQQRGFNLFRSAATRCFECHMAPTFTNNSFRAIGVPEEAGQVDPGRRTVADDAKIGAFRVPMLRNIALTAPYMHNGGLATLEEVVQFYADGGGRAFGNEDVDFFIQGFTLSEQEKTDLVAFLYALTDESALPAIPAAAPSGLPVVRAQDNPARREVAATNSATRGERPAAPRTLTVEPGGNIQAVVDSAWPGDVIEIPYAAYNQKVVVNSSGLTLRGIPDGDGRYPLLDGQGQFADGVLVGGNDAVIEFLEIRNYTANGVLAEGVHNLILRDLKVADTGIYGLYPVHSSGILMERIDVTGVNDAGIYAGQSEDIIVRNSVAYSNVIGIEIENSVGYTIYNNLVYNNSAGLFFDLLPQLTSKVATQGIVYDNLVENNNHPNFAGPEMLAGLMPSGVGVLLLGVDETIIVSNTISGNKTAGVAIWRTAVAFAEGEVDVADLPERNFIGGNTMVRNGYDADRYVTDLGIAGADIIWDGSAWNNLFDQPGASAFPPLLPGPGWPEPLRKGYWQMLNYLVNQLL